MAVRTQIVRAIEDFYEKLYKIYSDIHIEPKKIIHVGSEEMPEITKDEILNEFRQTKN